MSTLASRYSNDKLCISSLAFHRCRDIHIYIFFYTQKVPSTEGYFFRRARIIPRARENRSPPRRTIRSIWRAPSALSRRIAVSEVIYQGATPRAEVFRGKHLWNTPVPRNPSGSVVVGTPRRDSSLHGIVGGRVASGDRSRREHRDRGTRVRLIGRECFGGESATGWEPPSRRWGRAWGARGARESQSRAYINARRTVRLRRAVSTVAGRHTTIPAEILRQARFGQLPGLHQRQGTCSFLYTYPVFLFARDNPPSILRNVSQVLSAISVSV